MHKHPWNQLIKSLFVSIGWVCVVLILLEGCQRCNNPSVHPVENHNSPETPEGVIPDPGGIPNLINTCYMNAALQIVAKLYPDTFARQNTSLTDPGKVIVAKIQEDGDYVTKDEAEAFYTALLNEFPGNSERGRQEDVHEALKCMFKEFPLPEMRIVHQNHDVNQEELFPNLDRSPVDPLGEFELNLNPDNSNPIFMQEIFDAYFLPSQNDDYAFDRLPVQGHDKVNLERTYPGYTVVEEGGEFKIKGPINREAKLIDFASFGNNILPITLRRFSNRWNKNQTVIKEPFELVVGARHQAGNRHDKTYSLVGFVVHKGTSLAGGHYVAYIKKGEQWTEYNDATVTKVKEVDAKKAVDEAYLYFYKPK